MFAVASKPGYVDKIWSNHANRNQGTLIKYGLIMLIETRVR